MRRGLLLVLLVLAACGDLAPDKFTVNGQHYVLPAERNVPKETAVRPEVEVIVYDSTFAEVQEACGIDSHLAGGCSMLLAGLCMVWVLDPKIVPADTYARLLRHEKAHCNGYTHVLTRTETGWVIDWQSKTD